jgi:hypothetical protein
LLFYYFQFRGRRNQQTPFDKTRTGMKKEDEGEGEGELPQAPKAPPSLAINNFVGQYYQTSTFHHLSSWKGVST